MIEVGNIVTVNGQPGLWVVARAAPGEHPPRTRWRVWIERDGRRFERLVGIGDLVVMRRPTFVNGENISHDGIAAEVIADGGDDVVLNLPSRSHRHRGANVNLHLTAGRIVVGKADLVLENLKLLLKGNRDDDNQAVTVSP